MVYSTLNMIGSRGLKRTLFALFSGSASLGLILLYCKWILSMWQRTWSLTTINSHPACAVTPRKKAVSPVSFKGEILEKDTDWPSLGHVSILKYLLWTEISNYDWSDLGHMLPWEWMGSGSCWQPSILTQLIFVVQFYSLW